MVVYLEKDNFKEEISKGLVLVDFYAEWCGPCKMLGPVLEEASKETEIKIVKVDIDNFSEIAANYGIMAVPTLLVFKDGSLISQKSGYMPKELLLDWLKTV